MKITGSKFDMYNEDDTKAVTFFSCISGILDNDEVNSLIDTNIIILQRDFSILLTYPITAIVFADTLDGTTVLPQGQVLCMTCTFSKIQVLTKTAEAPQKTSF